MSFHIINKQTGKRVASSAQLQAINKLYEGLNENKYKIIHDYTKGKANGKDSYRKRR